MASTRRRWAVALVSAAVAVAGLATVVSGGGTAGADTVMPNGQLPDATAFKYYSGNVSKVLGLASVAPYKCAVDGPLPAGLKLASNCAISGTPTAAYPTFPGDVFQVSVTQSIGKPYQGTYVETIGLVVAPLTITVRSPGEPILVNDVIGVALRFQFKATAGKLPLTWSLSGDLPAGLKFSSAGLLTGTPTVPVTSETLTVTVHDKSTQVASSPVVLHIGGMYIAYPIIGPVETGLKNAKKNNLYASGTIKVEGGFAPYKWAVTSGALAPGLHLQATGATAHINGLPTGPGGPCTMTVTDSRGNQATGSCAVRVLQ